MTSSVPFRTLSSPLRQESMFKKAHAAKLANFYKNMCYSLAISELISPIYTTQNNPGLPQVFAIPHIIFTPRTCNLWDVLSSFGFPESYSLLSVKSEINSSFIPRACSLWNVLPSSCFPESYNLPSFKSKINILDLISLSS